jgi:hypothetical protein
MSKTREIDNRFWIEMITMRFLRVYRGVLASVPIVPSGCRSFKVPTVSPPTLTCSKGCRVHSRARERSPRPTERLRNRRFVCQTLARTCDRALSEPRRPRVDARAYLRETRAR